MVGAIPRMFREPVPGRFCGSADRDPASTSTTGAGVVRAELAIPEPEAPAGGYSNRTCVATDGRIRWVAQEMMSDVGTDEQLPENLTFEEAYRAAYYMVEQYAALEKQPDVGLVLLVQYMESDPARWTDWIASVRRGLNDARTINPHE